MTVGEMIEKLSKFDKSLEVTITDGYGAIVYDGDFCIVEFNNSVDIGVGGFSTNLWNYNV